MRFMHIADVHLGAVPDKGCAWSEERKEEIWRTFRLAVREAEKKQVDLLLIAGDLFHRQPFLRELKEVNYLLGRLTRTQVVMIAGNHDYLKPDSCYRDFEWAENVVFLDGKECECVRFPEFDTTVYGLSYHQREITAALYDGLHPDGTRGCHILLAHGGDDRHIPIDKCRLQESGFDYIALGHIHKPQFLAEGCAAYAGALEPLEMNDTGEHGYITGEYSRGKIRAEFVPFACREYMELKLQSDRQSTDFSMREQLEESIKRHGEHNIYKVRICGFRDPDIRYQTGQYLVLGNILEVSDETELDYDFEVLRRAHGRDVVGRYIGKLLNTPDEEGMVSAEQPADGYEGWNGENQTVQCSSEIRKKALYYGVWAMLSGGRE